MSSLFLFYFLFFAGKRLGNFDVCAIPKRRSFQGKLQHWHGCAIVHPCGGATRPMK